MLPALADAVRGDAGRAARDQDASGRDAGRVRSAVAAGAAEHHRAARQLRRWRRCCRASRAVVTVNSTVALDAAVLGVPALVIGLPNNLSPFVEAGIMAGAGRHGESRRRCAESCMMKDSACRLSALGASTAALRHRLGRPGRRAFGRRACWTLISRRDPGAPAAASAPQRKDEYDACV